MWALGVAKIRRRGRIYLLKHKLFSIKKVPIFRSGQDDKQRSILYESFSSPQERSTPHEKSIGDDEGYVNEQMADRQILRPIFDQMDTSGDGWLDAMELKLASRAFTGADLDLEHFKFFIKSVDTADGDGTIDFNEFCASVDHEILKL